MRFRTLANESYSNAGYRRAYNGTLSYERPVKYFSVGAEIYAGRDVFGDSFNRVGAFFRYTGDGRASGRSSADAYGATGADPSAELFVEAGASANRVKILTNQDLSFKSNNTGAHIAAGARRAVSQQSDLGARVELDDVDGHTLLSVRALDYRYRFRNPLAISAFVGASRYDLATPAYGLYFGAGVQWRDIMPGWDVGLDVRQATKVARDNLLPSDPQSALRPDSFYTISSVTVSLSKRF
jgi:hypothetical protein